MKRLLPLLALIALAGLSCNQEIPQIPLQTTTPPVSQTPQPIVNDKIKVDAPIPGALVTSPVTVKGQARGTWYFEASFPVKVFDAVGKELGAGVAQAQGEWMTTEFVPFEVNVTFSAPTTATGTIAFIKDNPSGLPENDDQVVIPVKFK